PHSHQGRRTRLFGPEASPLRGRAEARSAGAVESRSRTKFESPWRKPGAFFIAGPNSHQGPPCSESILTQMIEIDRFTGLGAQLCANILEHPIEFVVAVHDQRMTGRQAMPGRHARSHAGKVESRIAMQLELIREGLASNLPLHAEVHHRTFTGVVAHLIEEIDGKVDLARQAGPVQMAGLEHGAPSE